MRLIVALIVAISIVLSAQRRAAHASPDEYRLLQDLRKAYDIAERPIDDHHQSVNVTFKVLLQQILEVVSFASGSIFVDVGNVL